MSEERIKFLIENIQDQLVLGKSVSEAARKLRAIADDSEIETAVEKVKHLISARTPTIE